jgi:murein DD-endopeptidase MepM/ murein hydrolase activator NlpD
MHTQKHTRLNVEKEILLVAVLASIAITIGMEFQSAALQGSIFSVRQTKQTEARNTINRKMRLVTRKVKREAALMEKGYTNEKQNIIVHGGPPVLVASDNDSTVTDSILQNEKKIFSSTSAQETSFPPFIGTTMPVQKVPNWGAMKTPKEWDRSFEEMSDTDLVDIPAYSMDKLIVPLEDLRNPRNIPEITRKLTYSTHYFGTYDINSDEFRGHHPGIDIKLALNTPVSAIAGGKVQTVAINDSLGLYVIIEHRIANGVYFSIYGHFGSVLVHENQTVKPGDIIGTVGMTGNTSGPHVHIQIDKAVPGQIKHNPYAPTENVAQHEAEKFSMNPIEFIEHFRKGE